MHYPVPDARASGCKVSWLFYKDHATAKLAAELAETEGLRLADKGYDFGYLTPGALRGPLKDGTFAGLYVVTTP